MSIICRPHQGVPHFRWSSRVWLGPPIGPYPATSRASWPPWTRTHGSSSWRTSVSFSAYWGFWPYYTSTGKSAPRPICRPNTATRTRRFLLPRWWVSSPSLGNIVELGEFYRFFSLYAIPL